MSKGKVNKSATHAALPAVKSLTGNEGSRTVTDGAEAMMGAISK